MGVRAWLWRVGSRESRVRKWGLVVKPYATSMGKVSRVVHGPVPCVGIRRKRKSPVPLKGGPMDLACRPRTMCDVR